jgi:lipopolysaccharide export system permease protein
MHNKLELTAMKVMGISTFNIAKALLASTIVLGLSYITILDGLSAISVDKIFKLDTMIRSKSRGTDNSLTITNKGIWFRDTYDSSSYIIHARHLDIKDKSLFNIRVFEFGDNGELKSTIYSEKASISDGYWKLDNAKVVDIENNEVKPKLIQLQTKLRFSDINKMVAQPGSISFWSMKKYISMLEKVGLSSIKYVSRLFITISSILQMISFVILATAVCISYNARDSKKYIYKVSALLSSAFPIYFLNNIFVAFGENGNISIKVASFLIPIVTAFAGILLSIRGSILGLNR